MSTFKGNDIDRVFGESDAEEPLGGEDITPTMLMHYVDCGKRLRAAAMAEVLRKLATALFRLFGREQHVAPARAQAANDCRTCVEDNLKTPLTSIRAAAEILRDNADVADDERDRFLAVILEDSRRLEAFADRLLDGTNPNADNQNLRRSTRRDRRLEKQAA